MIKRIINFYTALAGGAKIENQKEIDKKYKRLRWAVFISATIGYSLFYVCRLSLSVVKKTNC